MGSRFPEGGGGSGKEGKGRLEDRRDILRDSIRFQNSDQFGLSGDAVRGFVGSLKAAERDGLELRFYAGFCGGFLLEVGPRLGAR